MFSLPCTEVACPCCSEWNERAVTRTAEGRGDGVIEPFPAVSPIELRRERERERRINTLTHRIVRQRRRGRVGTRDVGLPRRGDGAALAGSVARVDGHVVNELIARSWIGGNRVIE